MNKLTFSSLLKGHPQEYESNPTYKKDELRYPVLEVKAFHYSCLVERTSEYAHADFKIEATLIVSDTRDATPFAKDFDISEGCDLMEKEDDAGEGYVYEDGKVDLDELALKILVSSLPLRLTRDGSSLPHDGKGYRVLNEEEAKKTKEEISCSKFSALDDYKTDK